MSMHAWVIPKHGDIKTLRLEKKPLPTPGPNEALLKVRAIALNRLDLWTLKGVPGHHFPLPLIPGCDIVGTIENFGSLSTTQASVLAKKELKKNTLVLVDPMLSCGTCPACQVDNPPLCPQFGLFGETKNGGLSEFFLCPVSQLIPAPSTLTPETLCTIPIAYGTAWSMIEKAHLAPGDKILIQAGASGVGLAAIVFAKKKNAWIATTVGSATKAKVLKETFKVDETILYQQEPVLERLKQIQKKHHFRGFDAVIDHVGEKTFSDSLQVLKPGGKLLTCGATSGSRICFDLKKLFFRSLSIIGSTLASRKDLRTLVHLAQIQYFQPRIDKIFSFQQTPKAFAHLEARKNIGKVVIQFP